MGGEDVVAAHTRPNTLIMMGDQNNVVREPARGQVQAIGCRRVDTGKGLIQVNKASGPTEAQWRYAEHPTGECEFRW